jgi:hypothetical protein
MPEHVPTKPTRKQVIDRARGVLTEFNMHRTDAVSALSRINAILSTETDDA